MNFLTPLAGMIAAGIAIPSLLLLYFLKLRRREQVVPSTVLWRKAIQDLQVNAPFQKLRRNLLLLLQLIILCALALAFSQPTVPFRPSVGISTVLLIDRSASMSAKDGDKKGSTRLEEASGRAKELVSTLSAKGQAMVIAFDDRAEIVQGFTSDTQLLKKAIDSISGTDRPTKLKLAYQLADAQGALRSNAVGDFNDIKPPDVWVYSDGKVLDADEVSIRSEVKYEKLGDPASKNIGIVALSARRNYERPNEVQVFVRLANSGSEIAYTDVQLTLDGQIQKVARVTLAPERWTEQERQEQEKGGFVARDSAEFTLDMAQAGVVKVEQMLKDEDQLPADDSASVVVPPPKTLSVLLVSGGNNPFLSKLLRAQGLKDFTEITPEQYEGKLPEGKDVVLFDAYRPKALPSTGNFIYFGTLPQGLRIKAQTKDGALVESTEMTQVLDYKRDHPILRGLSLGKLVAQKGLTLQPAAESEVLVEGLDGPMMVLHREGRSVHLVIGFDPLYSDWPFRPSWPMFMHNTLQFLATSSDLSVRETYLPGATPRIPRTALVGLTSIKLISPTAPSIDVSIPSQGDVAIPALEHVGVYQTSPPVPGFESLAVNLLDTNESNITPAGGSPGGIGKAIEATTSKARLELWWWLVLTGAIPFLLVEWFVYTRRTHM